MALQLFASPSSQSCSFTWSPLDISSNQIVNGSLYVYNTVSQIMSNYLLSKTDLVGDCADPCVPPYVVNNLVNGAPYEAYLSVLLVNGSFIKTSNACNFTCDQIPATPTLISANYVLSGPSIRLQVQLGQPPSDELSINAIVLVPGADYYTVFPITSLTPLGNVYTIDLSTNEFSNGSNNSIAVVAQNNAGVSAPSNVIVVYASTAPAAPAVTQVLSGFDSSLPLTFTQQNLTVGVITGFDISANDVSNNLTKTWSIPDTSFNAITKIGNSYTVNLGAAPFNVPAVSDGLYYNNFRVTTITSNGDRVQSGTSTLRAIAATAPIMTLADTSLSFDLSASSITAEYAVPINNALLGNLAPVYYNLVLTNQTTGLIVGTKTNVTGLIQTFTGLTIGSTDTFSCAVVANVALTNTQQAYWQQPLPVLSVLSSNTINIVQQVPYAPGPVTGLNVIPFGSDSDASANFYLSWVQPASTGSSPIAYYLYSYSANGTASGFAPDVSGNGPVEYANFTGLSKNTNYWFRVMAVNQNGLTSPYAYVGPASSETNFRAPPVTAAFVSPITNISMTVRITADASGAYVPNGCTATFLKIYKIDPTGIVTTIANIPWATALIAGQNVVATTIPVEPAGSLWVFSANIVGVDSTGASLVGPSGNASLTTFGVPELVNVTSLYNSTTNQTTVTAKLLSNGCGSPLGRSAFSYLQPSDPTQSNTTIYEASVAATTPALGDIVTSAQNLDGSYTITAIFGYQPAGLSIAVPLVLLVNLQNGTAYYSQNL